MAVGSLGSEKALSLGESQPAEVWTLPPLEPWSPVTKCHTSCRSHDPQPLRVPTRWPQGPSKKEFQLVSKGMVTNVFIQEITNTYCAYDFAILSKARFLETFIPFFHLRIVFLLRTKMFQVTRPDVNRLSAVLWNLAEMPKSTSLIPASFVNKMLVPLTSRWVTLWLPNPAGMATVSTIS